MKSVEIDNPYRPPTEPTAASAPRPILWPPLLVGVLFSLLAAAAFIAFCWAGWYRLENTEAMGRLITPPSVPLYVVDRFLLAISLLGGVSVVVSFWAFAAAYERWDSFGR